MFLVGGWDEELSLSVVWLVGATRRRWFSVEFGLWVRDVVEFGLVGSATDLWLWVETLLLRDPICPPISCFYTMLLPICQIL